MWGAAVESTSVIDFADIDRRFAAMSAEYQSAEPFPHMSMHGLFSEAVLRAIAAEFPSPQRMAGHFDGEIEGGKSTESDWSTFGPVTQQFVSACNSGPFLRALSSLTGIPNLISDPYLSGGGQHQTGRGGRLKVHSDFNVHPFLALTRRLNMLVYLNDPWEESWGGSLELWDKDMRQAVVRVPPVFGQVALFTCSDTSFPGLPDPLSCPEGTYRRSIAFYYYTADAIGLEPRSTLWKERPGEDFLSRPRARIRRAGGQVAQALRTLTRG